MFIVGIIVPRRSSNVFGLATVRTYTYARRVHDRKDGISSASVRGNAGGAEPALAIPCAVGADQRRGRGATDLARHSGRLIPCEQLHRLGLGFRFKNVGHGQRKLRWSAEVIFVEKLGRQIEDLA